MRDPEIAGIAAIPSGRNESEESRVRWLADALNVRFPNDAEYMAIELRAPNVAPEDSVRLLNAVVRAYEAEVVDAERQQQQATKEVLERATDRLNRQIARETERYLQLAKDLNVSTRSDDVESRLMMEKIKLFERMCLDLQRQLLDAQVKQESMVAPDRAEKSQAPDKSSADTYSAQELAAKQRVYSAEIERLEQEIEKMMEQLSARHERSVDLQIQEQELELLRGVARDLGEKREVVALDMSNQGRRIELVQPAIWIVDSAPQSGRDNPADKIK
jgi:hypothetical protein